MSYPDFVLSLSKIFKQIEFDENARKHSKLIRHPLSNPTVKEMYKRGFIEIYQAEQLPETFRNCKYIFSFIGEGGSSARFIGCYEVGSCRPVREMLSTLPEKYPDKESFQKKGHVFFDLQKTDILKSLQNRLVVQWSSPRCWHLWATNDMPVIAITQRIQFPGYENVHLTYRELNEIIQEQSSEWFNALSKVCGVYLITTPEGLYVGSAYGNEGIWQRWSSYAKTYHGGNKDLTELLKNNPEAYREFQFSLLKVFPKKTTENDIRDSEQFFKEVLQTRNTRWGLNEN